jgi:hypothetical protein
MDGVFVIKAVVRQPETGFALGKRVGRADGFSGCLWAGEPVCFSHHAIAIRQPENALPVSLKPLSNPAANGAAGACRQMVYETEYG